MRTSLTFWRSSHYHQIQTSGEQTCQSIIVSRTTSSTTLTRGGTIRMTRAGPYSPPVASSTWVALPFSSLAFLRYCTSPITPLRSPLLTDEIARDTLLSVISPSTTKQHLARSTLVEPTSLDRYVRALQITETYLTYVYTGP